MASNGNVSGTGANGVGSKRGPGPEVSRQSGPKPLHVQWGNVGGGRTTRTSASASASAGSRMAGQLTLRADEPMQIYHQGVGGNWQFSLGQGNPHYARSAPVFGQLLPLRDPQRLVLLPPAATPPSREEAMASMRTCMTGLNTTEVRQIMTHLGGSLTPPQLLAAIEELLPNVLSNMETREAVMVRLMAGLDSKGVERVMGHVARSLTPFQIGAAMRGFIHSYVAMYHPQPHPPTAAAAAAATATHDQSARTRGNPPYSGNNNSEPLKRKRAWDQWEEEDDRNKRRYGRK